MHRRKDLATTDHEHTVRVGIVAPPEQVRASTRSLDERFAGRIVHQSLSVPAYGVDVLEVFDPAVNKWQGILHVARHHGIEPEAIIAVGDDVMAYARKDTVHAGTYAEQVAVPDLTGQTTDEATATQPSLSDKPEASPIEMFTWWTREGENDALGALVRAHQARGHTVVIATSALPFRGDRSFTASTPKKDFR